MQVRTFGRPFYEMNFIGNVWNFRISRRQLALWRNYNPIFDYRF